MSEVTDRLAKGEVDVEICPDQPGRCPAAPTNRS
jgi:hypothetical protein